MQFFLQVLGGPKFWRIEMQTKLSFLADDSLILMCFQKEAKCNYFVGIVTSLLALLLFDLYG